MGAPLIAFGMAAGRGMPTSGPWMIAAQRVFGFVFLGLAVWMGSRVLSGAAAPGASRVVGFAGVGPGGGVLCAGPGAGPADGGALRPARARGHRRGRIARCVR